MTNKVVCPQCHQTTTAYFCDCGKDLRALFPNASPPTPVATAPKTKTVAEFLQALGLEQYEQAFVANDITSELLVGITDDDLRSIGVESLGHRKAILGAAAASSTKPAPAPSYAPPPAMYQSAPAAPASTPGIIVAGFVLSFFTPLIGGILCFVGLDEARERGAGVALARAGIIISTAWTLIFLPLACLTC